MRRRIKRNFTLLPLVTFTILLSCYKKEVASSSAERQDVYDSGTSSNDSSINIEHNTTVRDAAVSPEDDGGFFDDREAKVQEETDQIGGFIDYSASRQEHIADRYLPLEVSEEDGWRESTEPYCDYHSGNISSDDNGIMLLGSVAPDGFSGQSLYFNDGKGWLQLCENVPVVIQIPLDFGAVPDKVNISKLSDTKYLFWNIGIPEGILSFNIGTSPCEFELDYVTESYVRDLFVVNENLAYALLEDGITKYDGKGWTRLDGTEVETGFANEQFLWADEEALVYLNNNRIYSYNRAEQRAESIEGLPPGTYTALWGFAQNDIWAGNAGNQLVHYDGEAWEIVWTGNFPTDGSGITMMWGMDQQLFFAGNRHFGFFDGQQAKLIANWGASQDSIRIDGLWGIIPTEVFLSYSGGSEVCRQGVLWYDGKEFRRF